ncbi:MAG: hypothetical protein KAI47_21480, partial [Deltaproteobacteria bacterium]|nr:hypothetical protein [Deltaproteobacteria bacterium]
MITVRIASSLAVLVMLASCSPDDHSPEGAAKLLFRAIAMHDSSKVAKLLAPETRKALAHWAELATAQTGGRRPYKVEELLALNLDRSRYRLGTFATVKNDGHLATVKITSLSGKKKEILSLIKVQGSWRIILPKSAFHPKPLPAPIVTHTASAPVTRPASATTQAVEPHTAPTTAQAVKPQTTPTTQQAIKPHTTPAHRTSTHHAPSP